MLAAMLLKLLEISLSKVSVALEGSCHFYRVPLAAYLSVFGADFAISPAKFIFSGVKICR